MSWMINTGPTFTQARTQRTDAHMSRICNMVPFLYVGCRNTDVSLLIQHRRKLFIWLYWIICSFFFFHCRVCVTIHLGLIADDCKSNHTSISVKAACKTSASSFQWDLEEECLMSFQDVARWLPHVCMQKERSCQSSHLRSFWLCHLNWRMVLAYTYSQQHQWFMVPFIVWDWNGITACVSASRKICSTDCQKLRPALMWEREL